MGKPNQKKFEYPKNHIRESRTVYVYFCYRTVFTDCLFFVCEFACVLATLVIRLVETGLELELELEWCGLDWTGLDWTGLELDWTGLDLDLDNWIFEESTSSY